MSWLSRFLNVFSSRALDKARVHPAFRVTDMALQSTLVDNTLVRDRVLALLAGFFSTVAIILVSVGLYGVLSYSVVRRTREIGIRLALGASPMGVVALMMSQWRGDSNRAECGPGRWNCRFAVDYQAAL